MRIAISVNVDPNNSKGYNIEKAYEENEALQFEKRKSTKGLKIGDIVYIWLTKPISTFMYKCEVVEIDSKNRIDDTCYCYHPEKRKEYIDFSKGTYSFKLISKIDKERQSEVTLETMRKLNLTKMNQVQGSCRDKKHPKMFDYLDEKFQL